MFLVRNLLPVELAKRLVKTC